jgi:hypothetical protein
MVMGDSQIVQEHCTDRSSLPQYPFQPVFGRIRILQPMAKDTLLLTAGLVLHRYEELIQLV